MKQLPFIFASLILSLLFPITALASTEDNSQSQIVNVNQLRDVAPTDWAYEALSNLSDRYGCIAGFPDRTYKGDRALTRYEFAAGLNSCLNQMEKLIAKGINISSEDLDSLQRLTQDFEAELASVAGRVNSLEDRVAILEDNQFSTTTKLKGQAIFAFNAGGFTGDRIIDPNGNLITENQPQATLLYRTNLDFDTSFTGTDNLKIRIDTGSNGFNDNAASFLEPNFGSILNYSDSPPRDGNIGVGRVYYSFKPAETLQVALGPAMVATDYIDFSQFTRPSFRGISTESLAQNYLLFPIEGPSGGAYTSWTIKEKFTLRATYNAAEAADPNENLSGIIKGLSTFTALLYPGEAGNGGLFGDFYQGIVELEYAPTETVAVRLQYSGGEVFDSRFDVFGINAEWQFLPRFAVFGRYSYGNYEDTAFGDIEPNYWMAGVSVLDLIKEGAILGIAAGQPFIASEIGNNTQTNFEAYYNYPISDFIAIAPVLQVISNAGNQSANDTIYTGTIRTVFNF
ncbi:iron uptake porin [Pleurocapsa sp. PCC 7319]|uniref:iron uptake porin n=1 Tax=Pleurocapsa sp. PCC 7319 TaxID=118161 RepID=UPI00034D4141|nr:iron uptake porin [Pleurocapsa sp. PCC 7319]